LVEQMLIEQEVLQLLAPFVIDVNEFTWVRSGEDCWFQFS
jgi:hypothetical protein